MSQQTKSEIRSSSLEIRRGLTAKSVREWSGVICRAFLASAAYQSANRVGLYVDLSGEVVTRSLFEACYAAGKRVAVPARVPSGSYAFAWVEPDTTWVSGAFDCEEPVEPDFLGESDRLDVVVVPGLAFSRDGVRLGFGKGIYDRLLGGPNCEVALCVGFGFEAQLRGEIPVEDHDRMMDLVLTEKGGYGAGTV